ncbi:MAG TPA: ArsR family transcriptional regulator [Candidatus Korarchaeota archaeon]|nr:ArsR family transcriptional regulator [Candidatus Korarchaeota archaeon]
MSTARPRDTRDHEGAKSVQAGGLLDRLYRIEQEIRAVERRLEIIEKLLEGDPEARAIVLLFMKIVGFHRASVDKIAAAIEAQRLLTQAGIVDDIARDIFEVLAVHGPMNVSELTRELRKIRGSASRRIVSQRLKMLEELGVVRLVSGGKGKRYEIVEPGDHE